MNVQDILNGEDKNKTVELPARCIAFEGYECIASGELLEVARKTKAVLDRGERAPVLIFDEVTSRPVELDFRGTVEEVVARLSKAKEQIPCQLERKRLKNEGQGVPSWGSSHEKFHCSHVTGNGLTINRAGASGTLRRIVEEAQRNSGEKDKTRHSQESVYRFMSALAGNMPNYEEALRAFYAGDALRFQELIQPWPAGIRNHIKNLANC